MPASRQRAFSALAWSSESELAQISVNCFSFSASSSSTGAVSELTLTSGLSSCTCATAASARCSSQHKIFRVWSEITSSLRALAPRTYVAADSVGLKKEVGAEVLLEHGLRVLYRDAHAAEDQVLADLRVESAKAAEEDARAPETPLRFHPPQSDLPVIDRRLLLRDLRTLARRGLRRR
mmetsp:Transcript_10036/g.23282  ORF Transcript_10036/g.23282 Transcript_10036/m.23282 type:complete len:179 (-) Transcript_10036:19-555(-)